MCHLCLVVNIDSTEHGTQRNDNMFLRNPWSATQSLQFSSSFKTKWFLFYSSNDGNRDVFEIIKVTCICCLRWAVQVVAFLTLKKWVRCSVVQVLHQLTVKSYRYLLCSYYQHLTTLITQTFFSYIKRGFFCCESVRHQAYVKFTYLRSHTALNR